MSEKAKSWSRAPVDHTGQSYGLLTAVRFAGTNGSERMWECLCRCGKTVTVRGGLLRAGRRVSCGCKRRTRPIEKTCSRCKARHPFTKEFFPTDRKNCWGLKSHCIPCARELTRRNTRKLRMEALRHYGKGNPCCVCCGVTEWQFLCLDHINNDGKQDRAENGFGAAFLYRMKKAGFPSHLQILCYNCNAAKQHFGTCPHQSQRNSTPSSQ